MNLSPIGMARYVQKVVVFFISSVYYILYTLPSSMWRKSLRPITTVLSKNPECKTKSFDEIPGPKPLPIIGNLWRYFPLIGEYSLDKIHRTYARMYEQFGPLIKEKVYWGRVIVHVFDPRDMYTVYKNDGHRPVRISHRALARYRRDRPHLYSCPGLFPSNGEEWYRFRHLFQKVLMAPSLASASAKVLEEVTDDLVAKIPSMLDANQEIDIQPLLFCWALECIGAVSLNRRLGCLSSEGNPEAAALVRAANEIHRVVFLTENSPLWKEKHYKELVVAQDYLASVVEKYLKEAEIELREGKNTDSVLSKMFNGNDVERKDVFTMISDMFLAGIDTTAYTLAFSLYNLANNKRVQDTLREELMQHLPEKRSKMIETSGRLPYLNCVIKETLRVNPVAIGTGRVIPEDLILSGYHVPAKTMVILQHQVSSMQDKYFPNAREFKPERWSERTMPLVSSPFGYGPRTCIGMRIAQKELQLALAKIVRNFSISYHYDKIDSCNRLINVPDKPMRLRLQNIDH